MTCVVCGKKVEFRFEGTEDTPIRDFIDMQWERARDLGICKEHEEGIAALLRQMIALGVNPEINPLNTEMIHIKGREHQEWLRQQGMEAEFNKYDSDYCAFELPIYATRMRKECFDLMDNLSEEKQKLARKYLEIADGQFAEGYMMGTITPGSWIAVGAYENVYCIICELDGIWELT